MVKLTIQTLTKSGMIAKTGLLGDIGEFNGYYFSGVLTVSIAVLVIVVSLLTPAPAEEQVRGLTYGSRTPEQLAENRASWNKWDVIGSVVVLGMVVGGYLYFTWWLT